MNIVLSLTMAGVQGVCPLCFVSAMGTPLVAVRQWSGSGRVNVATALAVTPCKINLCKFSLHFVNYDVSLRYERNLEIS